VKLYLSCSSAVVAAALGAVLVVPVILSTGSATAAVAPTYARTYCYAEPDNESNVTRRVLSPTKSGDMDPGNTTWVEATESQEVWDNNQKKYVSDSSFSSTNVSRVFKNSDVDNFDTVCSLFTDGAYPYPPARNPHDRGGPVLYLSKHGAPTQCKVTVHGKDWDDASYSDSISRMSCDGTLWMPKLKWGTYLHVEVTVQQPSNNEASISFSVGPTMVPNGVVDNDTAICFLVGSLGGVGYTNMSAKGGDCNGD
jgi:hypothetical protein